MHETGKQLLNLMFKEGEDICVSHNEYGYHSIPLQNAFQEKVKLLSTGYRDGKPIEECVRSVDSSELKLVALNPIKGWRDDSSCVAFRNFLVEMDDGTLQQQLEYIKTLALPYSAVVFSGGKSLHFLISLDDDLPDEKTWRKISEWILAIVTLADQNTKNPSRSIRIPGPKRENSRQFLVEYKGKVSIKELGTWLQKYPHLIPKEPERRPIQDGEDPRLDKMKKEWVVKALTYGVDRGKGRNKGWFAIACEFALAGFSEEDTIDILSHYFQEERDFKEREWKSSIKSGFNHIYNNRK